MLLALILAAEVPTEELLLVCDGAVMTDVSADSEGEIYDNRGNSLHVRGSSSTPGSVPFRVQVRIRGAVAEMNMPPAAGGTRAADGWRQVKQFTMTENEITGRVRVGLISAASFRIDRRTGLITSSGGYAGQCRKEDLSKRAF
jgi:hypothetical protein